MSDQDLKEEVFNSLKPLLSVFSEDVSIEKDTKENYYLNTLKNGKNGKPSFFGAVQIKKNYVSFHLMPVYDKPSLLNSISSDLKKKMHGKSCFNFTAIDETLLLELNALVKASYDFYRQEGLI